MSDSNSVVESPSTLTFARSSHETQESAMSISSLEKSLAECWNARPNYEMSRDTQYDRVVSPTCRQPELIFSSLTKTSPNDPAVTYRGSRIESTRSRFVPGGRPPSGALLPSCRTLAEPPVQGSALDGVTAMATRSSVSEDNKPLFIQPHHTNTRYRGDTRTRYFTTQIPGLRDELNCAIWLENLPTGINTEWLLSRVRTGAVYAAHINLPTLTKPRCAAKLVFTKHVGAAKLLDYLKTPAGRHEFGKSVVGKWNMHGHIEFRSPESRVLRILGKAPFMTLDFWLKFLGNMQNFTYQISHALQSYLPDGQVVVELGFGRVDSQARYVKNVIQKDITCGELADVEWAPDHCDC
ncbi:hypothetical protein ONS95_001010 [Cadophora gregata]|uniref:uncharacterized protein n=1 Tax=Cadophora gregata TaxID=51156 RepID=UPI0026DA7A26|nr:uncharacterized protein ONS95_001010 [Cadophora gregata]KAK0102195.1 hypothetical protein ONS96_006156 [Cadophora gregata f. sp. sojae]KAK0129069.1 hypothetical protein ONS95_001010 [Cadophora gregata]